MTYIKDFRHALIAAIADRVGANDTGAVPPQKQGTPKKYEFTGETIVAGIRTLRRIRALRNFADVKAGDLGGFIENESNLSHDGDCWVRDNARACQRSHVYGNAQISGDAWIYGDARVYDNAKIHGKAWIDGCVYGNAEVFGDVQTNYTTRIFDNAKVYGKADVNGKVYGNAHVFGNARIESSVEIFGNAKIFGNASVYSVAKIHGNAKICGNASVYEDVSDNVIITGRQKTLDHVA